MGCNKSGSTEINTQACVSNQTCIPPTASQCITVSNCSCGCTPCQCEQPRGTGTTPFYNQAAACQEDHKQFLIQQTFITAVATGKSFNMPACNASVVIYLPGVQQLQVGGYLWNVTYGYLQIVSFDFSTGTAVVKNNCEDGNASPGTQIPECTMFNVVDPPYDNSSACDGLAVYITADFVIPAVGNTVAVSVTGIEGLTIEGVVQIGSGYYTITIINSSTAITIQNDGGGGVPGTTVYAQDINGNCISPVVPYADTPCNRSENNYGSIVVCKNGVSGPLDATALGQVPVVINAATNDVEFQSLDLPEEVCTYLTACLNLVNGTDTYTIIVNDSSIFTIGELLVIHWPTIDGDLWVVDDIPDATHVDIISVDGNTVTDSVSVDILVCVAACCDQLQYKLDNPCDLVDWSRRFKVQTNNSGPGCEQGSVTEGNTFNSTLRSTYLQNDTCKDMRIYVSVDFRIEGRVDVNEMSWHRHVFIPKFGYSTGPYPGGIGAPALATICELEKEEVYGRGAGSACDVFEGRIYEFYHYSTVLLIPADTQIRLDCMFDWYNKRFYKGQNSCCGCEGILGNPNGKLTIDYACSEINVMGVAV